MGDLDRTVAPESDLRGHFLDPPSRTPHPVVLFLNFLDGKQRESD